jgi:uncharacterized protein (TIGR02646 family)
MRPIVRGASPQAEDFVDYRDAFGELAARIGLFCSYCERRIATQLAVEHIQPKGGPHGRPDLEFRWENFLLACANYNSTKGDKDVVLASLLLPDRDNTAAAYEYAMDGRIELAAGLTSSERNLAQATLALVGLDKRLSQVLDSNGQLVAIDRVAQRMEVWLIALDSKEELKSNQNEAFRRQIARTATGHGFFSIWMRVFEEDPVMRRLLITSFKGTATDCFDPTTTRTVSPRPPNGLPNGSKI